MDLTRNGGLLITGKCKLQVRARD